MRKKVFKNDAGEPIGYKMWLSATDVSVWSMGWPCSGFRGRRIFVEVDQNGLCDMTIGGRYPGDNEDIDGCALDAIVSDFNDFAIDLWPNWGKSPAAESEG